MGNGRGIEADSGFTPGLEVVGNNDVWNNADGNWINYPPEFGDLTTQNVNGTPADVAMNVSVDPEFFAPDDYHIRST